MNLEDIETSLRNGFHDAVLEGIDIDYLQERAHFRISIWDGLLPATGRDGRAPVMRRAVLSFSGLAYCAIEPPEALVDTSDGVNVCGTAGEVCRPNGRFPTGTFSYTFFATDWNSRVHVAAKDAELAWLESSEEAWSRARLLAGNGA